MLPIGDARSCARAGGTGARICSELRRRAAAGLEGFYVPSREEKLKIIELLGISRGFVAAFDAIRFKPTARSFADIHEARDFDLLEMKVTDKYLPNFPAGFFFGMTESEEMLLKVFKGKCFLCLVSLNPQNPKHCLVDWDD